MAKEESLTTVFDSNQIAQVGWFGFMHEIMSHGNNFGLYVVRLMKRF